MTIETNITDVISRLETFERQIHGVVLGAMEPGSKRDPRSWWAIARLEAEKRLRLMAKPEQQGLVAAFVETVIVEAIPYGMEWSMEEVLTTAVQVVEAVRKTEPGQLFGFANIEDARRAGDLVAEWVAKEKRREFPRDYDAQGRPLSTVELSRRIFNILFGEETAGRMSARSKLLPHIQEFADRVSSGRLNADEASTWLNAVLDAWRQRILAELPDRIRQALADLWERTA